jgi:hypothetical protein
MADTQFAGKVMAKANGASKLYKAKIANTINCQKKLDNKLVLPSVINQNQAQNELTEV